MTGLYCGTFLWRVAAAKVAVFPVFVTGLHCGVGLSVAKRFIRTVFPVFVTGLHCGCSPEGLTAWEEESSRSS